MTESNNSKGAEDYLQKEAGEMYGLLKHYEQLSFSLFQFYLTGIVAIVTITITVSEKLGPGTSVFGLPAIQVLIFALLLISLFVYSRQLWLQIRMTRTLRQINSIRGYFAVAYDQVAASTLYPTTSLRPSFLELRDPFQVAIVVLVNGLCVPLLVPAPRLWVSLTVWLMAVAGQLGFFLGILTRYECKAKEYQESGRDFIQGAPRYIAKDQSGEVTASDDV